MLIFPAKRIRAKVICQHVRDADYRGVVAFSCGNATRQLKATGLLMRVWVLDLSPAGDLAPTQKWWTPAEIHQAFPDLFDGTSGHLPAWMMLQIGLAFRQYLGVMDFYKDDGPKRIEVPTGSGETIICLRMVYPGVQFVPVFNEKDPATRRDPRSPLLPLALQGADEVPS